MHMPVETRWTQLQFSTVPEAYFGEEMHPCALCGWEVDKDGELITSALMEERCEVEGCPQSTGPTTTTT